MHLLKTHYTTGHRLAGRKVMTLAMLLVSFFNLAAPSLGINRVSAQVDTKSLLDLHNIERLRNNLKPLRISAELSASANDKAKAMIDSNCWSHYCPDGKSPWEFFTASGYEYIYAGENLAEGYYSNQEVLTAWMNSKTHRDNVMNGRFSEVGFGFARGRFQNNPDNLIIVVHFGSRREIPDQATLNAPDILFPTNNAYLNVNDVDIYGRTVWNEVQLTLNQQEFTVDASEGIFTKRVEGLNDGKYQLTAQAKDKLSPASPLINFTIDTQADSLTAQDFTLWTRGAVITIELTKTGVGSVLLSGSLATASMQQTAHGTWQADISAITDPELAVKYTDQAGNVTNIRLPLSAVTRVEQDGQNVLGLTPVNILNLVTVAIILGLITTDIYFMRRYQVGSHTHAHLHIGVLATVMLAILVNNVAGQILTGTSV